MHIKAHGMTGTLACNMHVMDMWHTCHIVYFFVQAVLPIKRAAAYTLIVFIRYNRRQEQRFDLVTWIIEGGWNTYS